MLLSVIIFEMSDAVVHLKDDGRIEQGRSTDLLERTF